MNENFVSPWNQYLCDTSLGKNYKRITMLGVLMISGSFNQLYPQSGKLRKLTPTEFAEVIKNQKTRVTDVLAQYNQTSKDQFGLTREHSIKPVDVRTD